MKVLLTGANGFVGSHVLDILRQRGIEVAALLRPGSDRQFIQHLGGDFELRTGSITEVASIKEALSGITHVIHCAGCTKAVGIRDFYRVNQGGTENVIAAVNREAGHVQRLVHVSSLAASGPATAQSPAREEDPPHPVSHYGRSKLAAEQAVRDRCRSEFVIVRPPAVYGPRDRGFLPMFAAVRHHLLPRSNPHQALSLVYVQDLAKAIVVCLEAPGIVGKTFFASSPEVVSGVMMAKEIARQSKTWTVPCPLHPMLLWPVCAAQDGWSRITGKAAMLSLQKFADLRASGWVCSPAALQKATGFECGTTLSQGVTATLSWYREHDWL